MRGLPDWGRPVAREGAWAYAPFERDGPLLAPPDGLVLAAAPDGRPNFQLVAIRALGAGAAHGYGRLDLEFALTSSMNSDEVRALPALRGWLRLRSEMLGIPPEFLAPAPLGCSGLCLARLVLPLSPEGVLFVEAGLAEGALPILAGVDLELAGIAPRMAGTATVDLARLHRTLSETALTPAALRDRIAADPETVGVSFADLAAGDETSADPAAALADRIRAELCPGPLVPAEAGGLALALPEDAAEAGEVRFDLARPVVATRAISLGLDPFAAARTLAAGQGGTEALIVRGSRIALPTGRHRITLDHTLSRPFAGPLGLGATLEFPARPPARLFAVRRDLELATGGGAQELDVQLAPDEPLDWTVTGFAFWPTKGGRGVARLAGPARPGSGDQVLIRPADLPLRFYDIAAGPALLELAAVTVRLTGTWEGESFAVAEPLTPARPRLAIGLPDDAEPAEMTAILSPHDGGAAVTLGPFAAGDWPIELADLPGFGPRAVEIAVILPEGVPFLAVELRPEEAGEEDEPAVYAFTPAAPSRTHRWLCRNPFRPGLMWRWRGETAFSGPVSGQGVLELSPEGAIP